MNKKLVFVSIIAIVTAFAVSAIAIGLSQNVQAMTNCQGKGTINVGVCGTEVCANVQALTGKVSNPNCQNN